MLLLAHEPQWPGPHLGHVSMGKDNSSGRKGSWDTHEEVREARDG